MTPMPPPTMGQTGQKYQAATVIASVSQMPIISSDAAR
jgi:hypothetical protein